MIIVSTPDGHTLEFDYDDAWFKVTPTGQLELIVQPANAFASPLALFADGGWTGVWHDKVRVDA